MPIGVLISIDTPIALSTNSDTNIVSATAALSIRLQWEVRDAARLSRVEAAPRAGTALRSWTSH